MNNSTFLIFYFAFLTLNLTGCFSSSIGQPETPLSTTPTSPASVAASPVSLPESTDNKDLLQQSWVAYRQQFIQNDGRVIDREGGDRSTSEGQAYAMLRAFFINDRDTFAKTLNWAENNLQRQTNGKRSDNLWAWKWGRDATGKWGILDRNFASDADVDVITSLILASRAWNRPEYLTLARTKLRDLWMLSTITVPSGTRYLLPGPKEAFQPQPSIIKLNPSYLAPYAFRLFAQVDPAHDWLSLVDSSYQVLENSAQLSAVKLPSDWVILDTETGQFQPLPSSDPLKTQYGFDAYRVWWRVALDAAWFKSPQALQFLRQHMTPLQEQWRTQQKIPAQIDLQGQPIVDYEATSQYAMVYAALRLIDPATAEQILQRKLLPSYKNGIWDNDSAYYAQNLAWLGLMSPTTVTAQLLKPNGQ
ncbi:MAG: glycosyl hydrolase family 8 [Cyanobacteriota bacterium]